MSDLTKGYTFSGTSPNNNVTAEKLNTLVDAAQINTGFLTGKAETISAADGDFLLLYDSAGAVFRKIRKANLVTSAVARSGFSNLRIATNPTAPTSRLDVTADEIVMRATTGNVRHVASFNRVLNSASYSGGSTADGRDFASEAANTWYYVWAISDGVNDRTLLSASASSPALPNGFEYKALLGCVRNDNASDFVPFVQRNCDVAIAIPSLANVTSPQLNPWTASAVASPVEFTEIAPQATGLFASVDLSRCVPPGITARVRGIIGATTDNTKNNTYVVASSASGDAMTTTGAAIGAQTFVCFTKGTDNQLLKYLSAASFETVVGGPSAPFIYWAVHNGGSSEKHSMRINGYTLSL